MPLSLISSGRPTFTKRASVSNGDGILRLPEASLPAMRQRTASQTTEEREARLLAMQQPLRPQSREKGRLLVSQTTEEREARVLAMCQRIASQTPEERESCCQQMRLSQQQNRASDTPDVMTQRQGGNKMKKAMEDVDK